MADIQEAVTALVRAKQEIDPAAVVRWAPADYDRQYREWYYQASKEGVIVQINLAVRACGVEASPGQFHWEYQHATLPTITARHDATAGTTLITVGGVTVLDNATAGREVFNPGDYWLNCLGSAYAAKLQAQEHALTKEREKLQASKAADFLTRV